MKISDARANLADVIASARDQWKTTILTDRGKDACAIVPMHVLEKFRLWQEQETYRSLTAAVESSDKGTAVGITISASEIADLADLVMEPAEAQRRLKDDFLAKAKKPKRARGAA